MKEEFDKWLKIEDEGAEWLFDVSGGDWDDLVEAIRKAFYAGWDARQKLDLCVVRSQKRINNGSKFWLS